MRTSTIHAYSVHASRRQSPDPEDFFNYKCHYNAAWRIMQLFFLDWRHLGEITVTITACGRDSNGIRPFKIAHVGPKCQWHLFRTNRNGAKKTEMEIWMSILPYFLVKKPSKHFFQVMIV